jgi:thymidylate synthase (FAD)
MRVKLLNTTSDPIEIMWAAARTCYSNKSPIDMYDELGWEISEKTISNEEVCDFMVEQTKKHWKLVKQVLDSGHLSVAEHINFTFAIEGISRACSHQLVRHRHCTFSQQSQRYVEIKEDLDHILQLKDDCINNNYKPTEETIEVLDKYFVGADNSGVFLDSLIHYLGSISNGMKPEDARQFLPNATKTNIVMTLNLRELIHICGLRLCTRAQSEIRSLFKEISNVVYENNPLIGELLKPQCEQLGYCPEKSCCGRAKRLQDLK